MKCLQVKLHGEQEMKKTYLRKSKHRE